MKTDITKQVVDRLRKLATVKLDDELNDTTCILLEVDGGISPYLGICAQMDAHFGHKRIYNSECNHDWSFEEWLMCTQEYEDVRYDMTSWSDAAAWNDPTRHILCLTLADKIEQEEIEFWIKND